MGGSRGEGSPEGRGMAKKKKGVQESWRHVPSRQNSCLGTCLGRANRKPPSTEKDKTLRGEHLGEEGGRRKCSLRLRQSLKRISTHGKLPESQRDRGGGMSTKGAKEGGPPWGEKKSTDRRGPKKDTSVESGAASL